MNKAVRKFGWIAFLVGAIGFGLALILGQELSYETQELIGWGIIGMTAALVYFGIAFYRDKVNQGYVSMGQAFKTGILIAGLGALGVALIDVFFTSFINPNFFNDYGLYQLELAEAGGDAARIAQVRETNAQWEAMSPWSRSFMGGAMIFLMTFLLGLVTAFVSALLLKKQKQ